MLFSFFLAVITLVCLVPFGVSVFYLLLGIKSCITGLKESNRQKTNGGIYSIFFSVLGISGSYVLWRFLVYIFFPLEL